MSEEIEGKVSLGVAPTPLPMPCAILITKDKEDRLNCMTLSWFTRVNAKPAAFGLCVNKVHKSHANLEAGGNFSLNFPSSKDFEKHDGCGLVSGKRAYKGDVWDVVYTKNGTPIAKDCPYSIEFGLKDQFEFQTNTLFVGEVLGSYADESVVDKHVDPVKADPFVLTMPDNTYWKLGEKLGKAWSSGVNVKKELTKKEKEKKEA